MTTRPEQLSPEPWKAMNELPVQSPYTPADFQAIAAALVVGQAKLSEIAVPRPGVRVIMGEPWSICPGIMRAFNSVRVIMGEPWYPVPLSVTLCPIADALQDAARLYLAYLHFNARPHQGASRNTLTRLRRDAERAKRAMQALCADLEGVDTASRETLYRQGQPPLATLERLARLKEQAQWWAMEIPMQLTWMLGLVDTAIQTLGKDKGGRPSDTALHVFIRRLGFFYECVTGKRPGVSMIAGKQPSGPFFRFTRACLTPLTPWWGEAHNTAALCEHIKTVLNAYKDK